MKTMDTPDARPAGLSSQEAALRLGRDGPNELPDARPRRLAQIAFDVLAEPMLLLLIAASLLYIFLGEAREAIALSASMVIVVIISIVQERRTERALLKLRELTSPRALVIRDATEQLVPGRDLVAGDLVLLREGGRVPADARVLSATSLSIDESILTGESLPMDKTPADGANQVYSGCLVASGYATAVVTATGSRSKLGQIGSALQSIAPPATPLQLEIREAVKWVATAAIALCLLVAIFYGASRHDWLGGALAGITLAMGAVPEEIPVVLAVFLALGAWRMSRQGVLIRRMPAVETIGAVTVLAVDKTGTLTENRMRVAAVATDTEFCDLRSDQQLDASGNAVLSTALAACELQAFDPMEKAIHEAASTLLPDSGGLAGKRLVHEYDLTPELLAVTHVWCGAEPGMLQVAVKGAPETVFKLCRLPQAELADRLDRAAALANEGLRVLAVACGHHPGTTLPDSPHGFELRLLGLLCLADPIRETVPAALAQCAAAGIRVVMITGDHPGTARAIARQAGFAEYENVLTGTELASLDDATLCERVKATGIYARTSPQQKLRLVQAFKANGEVIAMTGDGVNDAPALKAAHIGVAMGKRGTDVAREAASIVLVEDDFAALVATVRSGRRIYENIGHAMAFIIAVHIPIAGMGLLPVLFGWPLLLMPLHVLFLEFIIDPACSFVFEAERASPGIMQRRPRSLDNRLFSPIMLRSSILLGTATLAYIVLVYFLGLSFGSTEEARALGFAAMVISDIALILVNRSSDRSMSALLSRSNPIFWWLAGFATALLGATLYVPVIAGAFRFSSPPVCMLAAVAAGAGICVFLAARMLTNSARSVWQPA